MVLLAKWLFCFYFSLKCPPSKLHLLAHAHIHKGHSTQKCTHRYKHTHTYTKGHTQTQHTEMHTQTTNTQRHKHTHTQWGTHRHSTLKCTHKPQTQTYTKGHTQTQQCTHKPPNTHRHIHKGAHTDTAHRNAHTNYKHTHRHKYTHTHIDTPHRWAHTDTATHTQIIDTQRPKETQIHTTHRKAHTHTRTHLHLRFPLWVVALHFIDHAVEVTDGSDTALVFAHDGDDGQVMAVQGQVETLCGEIGFHPWRPRLLLCK